MKDSGKVYSGFYLKLFKVLKNFRLIFKALEYFENGNEA